ncbi:MAG: alpha/beta hydrolase [Planctomycetota bacterium]
MSASTSFAQTKRDLAYDDQHPSQRLDVYLAKSDEPVPVMIFIHGGGWRAGTKRHVPAWLLDFVAAGELSVVSVEYRFTDVATHPAQVNDCLRAIQYVRHHAKEWNIDPKRVGVTGGSAGGHLSAYVTLVDDAAKPKSKDLVEQQSSRVSCGVSFAGPTDWTLLKTLEHNHPAYRQLIDYEPKTPYAEMAIEKIKNVSPIKFASEDDPPLMQVHGDNDVIVPIQHAQKLHAALSDVHVESRLVTIEGGNHGVAGAGKAVVAQPTDFVRRHLLRSQTE